MDYIRIDKVIIYSNRIEVHFITSDHLRNLFKENLLFWAEYNIDISGVPKSIAVIPFICSILPIIWITNSKLIVEEIDSDFYNSINEIKQGYIEMFPMMNFDGSINATSIVDNSKNQEIRKNVVCLFSGGIDAFATLLAHIGERPQMVTIWGADVRLKDESSWNNVEKHVAKTANDFNLMQPIFVKSNFTEMLLMHACDKLVSISNDNYWHGFQHGIGLISLCAPIAYANVIYTIYIASTFTFKDKGKITCASDPTIDNHLHFCGTQVWHDQYDKNRQQKISLITNFCKTNNKHIHLRTCFMQEAKGDNCCKCEKCLRTIFGILAEDENPINYGYNISLDALNKPIKALQHTMYLNPPHIKLLWSDIKVRFNETQSFKHHKSVNWIYKYNFNSDPTITDLLFHYKRAIIRRCRKLFQRNA